MLGDENNKGGLSSIFSGVAEAMITLCDTIGQTARNLCEAANLVNNGKNGPKL